MKFILLHEAKNDDGIKSFFMDVWELYIKVRLNVSITDHATDCLSIQTSLNPFQTSKTPIRSSVFDSRVKASAKKYL